MIGKRIKRINELIKRELGQIILREIEPPEGSLITLTQVETTPDLESAKVWVSVFPIEQVKKVLAELRKKAGYLQGLLNRRLRMRPLPRIKFLDDRSEEKIEEVETIFHSIKN